MEGTAFLRAPCKNYFQSRFKLFGFSSRKSAETAAGWPGCSFSWEGARPRLSFLSSHKYYSKLPLSDRSFAERVACWARFGHRFTLLLPWITSLLGRDDAPPRPKAETAPMAIWGGKRCERKVIMERKYFHAWDFMADCRNDDFVTQRAESLSRWGKGRWLGGLGAGGILKFQSIRGYLSSRFESIDWKPLLLKAKPLCFEIMLILFRTIEKNVESLRFWDYFLLRIKLNAKILWGYFFLILGNIESKCYNMY